LPPHADGGEESLPRFTVPVPVLAPAFQDWSGGKFRVISFYAKGARGLMARFAILNRLTDAAGLKDFAVDGYTSADQRHALSSGGSCRW
jgi:cytoplasmic iron level regulating protein YaaA (DUF328/UPF0246 family)